MKKIAFYGGGFDPIHFGHLNLAIQIKEIYHLDEVHICPAFVSPHKIESPPIADPQSRFEMASIAVQNIKGFTVCDLEIKRKGVSFTYDTINSWKETVSGELFFIITEDVLPNFTNWKNPHQLIQLVKPIVGTRKAFTNDMLKHFNDSFKIAFQQNVVQTKVMDISSTYIRERVKNNLYCAHLTDAKVLDFIYKHHLYSL